MYLLSEVLNVQTNVYNLSIIFASLIVCEQERASKLIDKSRRQVENTLNLLISQESFLSFSSSLWHLAFFFGLAYLLEILRLRLILLELSLQEVLCKERIVNLALLTVFVNFNFDSVLPCILRLNLANNTKQAWIKAECLQRVSNSSKGKIDSLVDIQVVVCISLLHAHVKWQCNGFL